MALIDQWHSVIAAESFLLPDAARTLRDVGFVVMPGPVIQEGMERLSDAYDQAIATADSTDVRISSSTDSGPLCPAGSSCIDRPCGTHAARGPTTIRRSRQVCSGCDVNV